MIPVTLTKLDNYVGFLGSFDGVNWWKTKPLPGSVDYVNDAVWVYGQYHVCSAKMLDGTYRLFRSSDNGYSWSAVGPIFTNIGCLVCPDYGVVIASTNDGWWRSINSGRTWSKISSSAPNCFYAKELTNDILVALSRNNVWKSTNGGTTWTSIFTSGESILYPTIDGTQYDLLLAIGKTIFYSDNAGVSWYDITTRITNFPTTSSYSAITDIEMTSTFSHMDYETMSNWSSDDLPTFVVQVKLPNNILRHYHLLRTPGADATEYTKHIFTASARFDAVSGIKNSLTSSESQQTGSELVDKAILFSGMTSAGKPLMMKSIDGGWNWTTLNTSNATIYTGPDLSQISSKNNFLDDVYFTATWAHAGYCHNGWTVGSISYQKNQSFDVDFLLRLYTTYTLTETYSLDTLIEKMRSKGLRFDVLNQKTRRKLYTEDVLFRSKENFNYIIDVLFEKAFTKTFSMDILEQKTCTKAVSPDMLIEKQFEEYLYLKNSILKTCNLPTDMYMELVLRFYINTSYDMLLLKTCTSHAIFDVLNQDINTFSYGITMKVEETIIKDILHVSNKFSIQALGIGKGFDDVSYDVFDSRKRTKE